MALINFQKQFAEAVKSGEKRQTIRFPRKYPIKKGETLYLYTGLRTKNTEKLKEVKCFSVEEIIIYETGAISVGDVTMVYLDMLNTFAKMDGFKGYHEMMQWLSNTHGLPFKGWLIKW